VQRVKDFQKAVDALCIITIGEEGEAYYQVAYTVVDADGTTLKREWEPLNAIKDHNPKFLFYDGLWAAGLP